MTKFDQYQAVYHLESNKSLRRYPSMASVFNDRNIHVSSIITDSNSFIGQHYESTFLWGCISKFISVGGCHQAVLLVTNTLVTPFEVMI